MSEEFRCELVSWNRVYQLARRLAQSIRAAAFEPDVVVAIARGGYVPARLLCDFFDVSNLTSIRIVHYAAGAQRAKQARIVSGLGTAIRGLNVLVVDDVSDTGETLELAEQHLRSFDAAVVRVAVLHHKVVAAVQPDWYAQKVVKWRWIIYPWAVVEDVSGFLGRMDPIPGSLAEAALMLEEVYGLRVPSTALEDAFTLLGKR